MNYNNSREMSLMLVKECYPPEKVNMKHLVLPSGQGVSFSLSYFIFLIYIPIVISVDGTKGDFFKIIKTFFF